MLTVNFVYKWRGRETQQQNIHKIATSNIFTNILLNFQFFILQQEKREIELFHTVSIIFSFRYVKNIATHITSCQVLFQEQMTAKSQEEATCKQNMHTKNFPTLS